MLIDFAFWPMVIGIRLGNAKECVNVETDWPILGCYPLIGIGNKPDSAQNPISLFSDSCFSPD